MRVYCTGRHSEPHNEQAVHGVLGRGYVEVFECPLCKYDVHVDREFEAPGEPIELHRLAQLVTAARGSGA